MDQFPEALWRRTDLSPVCFVKVDECRNFLKSIIADTTAWNDLPENWGGHFHRALLSVALSGKGGNELVDIVPEVLTVTFADTTTKLPAITRASAFMTTLTMMQEDSADCSLADIHEAMKYNTDPRIVN